MGTAIILSVGKGTKIWPYAQVRPKTLISISNKPIIKYQLEILKKEGYSEIILAVNDHEQAYRYALRDETEIHIVQVGPTEGNAETLKRCLEKTQSDYFTVFYADVLFSGNDFRNLISENQNLTVLVQDHHEPSGNFIGCNLDSEGFVTEIIGHSRLKTSHHFLAFQLNRDIIPYLEKVAPIFPSIEVGMMPPHELYLEAALVDFIKAGNKLRAIKCQDSAFDIDKPWHILQANQYYNRKICSKLNKHKLSEGSHIDPTASVEGWVRLGKNSKIGKNVIIEGNVWVGDGTEIKAGAVLKGNNVIGDNCEIGYYCYLEEGSTVGHRCKVLHAAELSGILFDGVYLYHYMEIAGIVGENTDIGAGTVCGSLRFDDGLAGQKVKGRSEKVEGQDFANACYIGDYARTGINAILLPGVKTGTRSIVGPGVILSEDLEDGKLVLVKQQTYLKDWGPEKYGW